MAVSSHFHTTIVALSCLPLVLAWPAWPTISSFGSSLYGLLSPPTPLLAPRTFPSNFQLKVLCVGDSITVGFGDGEPNQVGENNGYRLDLYNLLTGSGMDVEFIGTQSDGTNNPQPRHEGYGFQVIDTILGKIQENGILAQQPNLVLIHAGTNDNDLPQTSNDPSILYADAPYRLGNLIDYVLCQDPNAVVLVAKLIQNKYNQEQTNAFNAEVSNVVGLRYMKGYKVRVVDFSMIGGSELGDLLHPTAAGYADMANRWYSAILGIPQSWWAVAADTQPGFGGPLLTCDRNSISYSPAINSNEVAPGFHVANDPPEAPGKPEPTGDVFSPGWNSDGVIAIGTGLPGSGVIFADLDGDGRPDYIWANYTTGSEGAIKAWLNGGTDVWNPVDVRGDIAWGEPGTSFVEFADLTGDKKAEYILIVNGQFKIWQNGGPNGQVWNWEEMTNAENELNYIFQNSAPFHYFADITGDGLADLIIYNPDTVLDLYINDGPDGNGGFTWTQCKAVGIATGSLFFVDIDGDGKADYVSSDSDGSLSGWLNNYGGGCNITWTPINGRTTGSLALGTGSPIGEVRLADFTGDGKADYLVVDDNGGAVSMWTNMGSFQPAVGTGIGGYGAAVRLNDMDGDGRDDYVSVTNYSGIAVYLNGGQGSGDTWIWNEQANGNVVALGFPDATRHEVHLADMNADGRDDYLVIDDDTGALHCYLNLGPSATSGWNCNIMGEIAIGVSGVGAGVRLADFDGDGRADYIYLDQTGAAKIWRNGGPGNVLTTWQVLNGGAVSALGVGANREDVFFADIDGDGKADYCWIHPDTGELEVWYNLWDGSHVGWLHGGVVIPGQGYPGQNIRLARLGTSGRFDYVAVEEDNGALRAWFNDCANVIATTTRAIAGACGNPPLPTQSTSEPAPAPAPTKVSTNQGGQTVIQGTGGVQYTLPLSITSPTTVTETDGEVFTYIPGGNTAATTFTNAGGQTVVQGSLGDQTTLSPGISRATTVTESNGEVVTYNPGPTLTSSSVATTTDSAGQTVLSQGGDTITIPRGLTAPTTTTAPDGVVFTFYPSSSGSSTTSSNTLPVGIIFPLSTSVAKPTATNGVTEIPCVLWFFFICIQWEDVSIHGWEFDFPPGTIGPGPPPAITIPGVEVHTIGPLPPWPKITVGSDRIPTFSPDSQPTDCQTETGQICLTTTSYGVSGSSTTASSTLSTCATVYGCEVTDSESATTTATTTKPPCSLTVPWPLPFSSKTSTGSMTPPPGGSTPTATTSLAPAQTSAVNCHPSDSEPGHNDVHANSQASIGALFCIENNYTTNATGPYPAYNIEGSDGTQYWFETVWKQGCQQVNPNPSIWLPLGANNINCEQIFTDTYTQCNNGGIGGYIDAGCLRYNFIAGLGNGATPVAADGWLPAVTLINSP